MAERTSKVRSLQEATALVKDGDTIAVGGIVSTNRPMAILRQLMKERRRDLSIITFQGGLDIDLMIGLGMVKTLTVSYMGAEALAPVTPFYARRACDGGLEIEEVDLGTVLFMLRARAQRLPFLPSWGPVGTSLPKLNPRLKVIEQSLNCHTRPGKTGCAMHHVRIHANDIVHSKIISTPSSSEQWMPLATAA